ncbi:hypothetical protein MNAN1_001179 [Malassezia nana]|uniref:Uncharacterized protein n=1 Tax=Malassezia nana TaxID=180528 RepID=A0AAF0EGU7_9BASI|nr:hypothetical protein MNAN1_001179 [Malassezia nana]
MATDLARVSQALAALPSTPVPGDASQADVLSVAAPLLADLKRINRDAYAYVAEGRGQVASARERADECALSLAALQYEASKLRECIEACGDVEPVYEQVLSAAHGAETDAPREPAAMRDHLQATLDGCRRWEQEVRALEAEVAELQKQSHASHRSLVRMEKDVFSLRQVRTRY